MSFSPEGLADEHSAFNKQDIYEVLRNPDELETSPYGNFAFYYNVPEVRISPADVTMGSPVEALFRAARYRFDEAVNTQPEVKSNWRYFDDTKSGAEEAVILFKNGSGQDIADMLVRTTGLQKHILYYRIASIAENPSILLAGVSDTSHALILSAGYRMLYAQRHSVHVVGADTKPSTPVGGVYYTYSKFVDEGHRPIPHQRGGHHEGWNHAKTFGRES